jgi:DNA adenine methylase
MGKPFVKWAGGKAYLIPEILKVFPKNRGTYFEPMLGGGALFFYLQKHGMITNSVLSDNNEDLINTYRAIKHKPKTLVRMLKVLEDEYLAAEDKKQHYLGVRSLEPDTMSPIEKAARFIYLNKTCFNGLYRVNKKGGFNVPFGQREKPKICDIPRIISTYHALRNAELTHRSVFRTFNWMSKNSIAYIDPPYWQVATDAFVSYTKTGFDESDQKRLAACIHDAVARGVYVIASNLHCQPISYLYRGMCINIVSAPRRINSDGQGRGNVNEVIIHPKDPT